MSKKERVLLNAEKYCRYEYIKLTYTINLDEKEVQKSLVILMN